MINETRCIEGVKDETYRTFRLVAQMKNGGATMAKDPACGMNVDENKAAGTAVYNGKTYYFCCAGCKAKFEKEPEKYVKA